MEAALRSRLNDPDLKKYLPRHLLDVFNVAQDWLGTQLAERNSWRYTASDTQNLADGTVAYTLPEDFQMPVLIKVDVNNSGTFRQAKPIPLSLVGALDINRWLKAKPLEPYYSFKGNEISIYPTPSAAVTNGLDATYVRKIPKMRLDRNNVTGTADSGTATTLVDAAGLTQIDDWWNNCILEMTSGTIQYEERLVSDFAASSDTITVGNAFSAAISTNTYTLWENSVFPEEYHVLLLDYAQWLVAGDEAVYTRVERGLKAI
jgi:hypothetical protein